MNAYYIMGAIVVAWALILSAIGLRGESFPATAGGMRAVIGFTALLVVGATVALMATTHKEHPRVEAAEAAERAAELEKEEKNIGEDETQSKAQKQVEAGNPIDVEAIETEFKIDLPGGDTIESGDVVFDVVNAGEVPHDLAVRGNGIEEAKSPLFDGGEKGKLNVNLESGKYTLYCTVPGHEQSGMKLDLKVE